MTKLCKTLLAALVGSSFAATAFAANPPAPPVAPVNAPTNGAAPAQGITAPAGTPSARPAPIPQQTRTTHKARVDAEQAALFQQADSNRDGQLSPAEFARFNQLKEAAWQARQQQNQGKRFDRLDRNKDGALSQDELKAARPQPARFKQPEGAPQPPKPVV